MKILIISLVLLSQNLFCQSYILQNIPKNAYKVIDKIYLGADSTNLQLQSTRTFLINSKNELLFMTESYPEHSKKDVWLRQNPDSPLAWDVYKNDELSSQYSEKSINDSTVIFQFISNEKTTINSEISHSQSLKYYTADSLYKKTTNTDRFNSIIHYYKSNGDTTQIQSVKILEIDQNNNWRSKRTTDLIGRFGPIYTKIERDIFYHSDHILTKYQEITLDYLKVNDTLMSPSLNKELFMKRKVRIFEKDGRSISDDFKFSYISSFYHKRFLSDKYFFYFKMDQEELDEILNERLLGFLRTKIFELDSDLYYVGRTKSNRWFEYDLSQTTTFGDNMTPYKTGKSKIINGFKCHQYAIDNREFKELYYIYEDLPFVFYQDFPRKLPGLVMYSKRKIKDIGIIENQINIENCLYPYIYMEYLTECKDLYKIEFDYIQEKTETNK